jgi:geranylgeranyl reductase family protein
MENYDAIVIGGGPAGSSCTAFLSKAGKKVLLLDRAKFPREKICGDGISGRSVGVLKELGILKELQNKDHEDMYGVTFSSPNGTVVPVKAAGSKEAPGFVCTRMVLDDVLFQNAKKLATKTIEEFLVTDFIEENGKLVGIKGTSKGELFEYRAKVIVGADGAAGFTARKLGVNNSDANHQSAGVRAYYENVGGMGNKIELHFVKETLPGYFWIFPLPDGRANVGIAILVSHVKSKKINLAKLLEEITTKNPVFKERFKDAKRSTDVRSWLLPLATKKIRNYGNGYVLIGDASSLIDPFTGEGIGNALTSGKVSAQVIIEALEQNNFSEEKFSEYHKKLYKIIQSEVNTNNNLLRMCNHPFLVDLIIGKAHRSKDIREVISDAILNPDNHKNLTDPVFFVKALFA